MNAKLQSGTTPGNPTLTNQLKEGQQQIEVVAENISKLNDLSNDVDAEAGTASWLLDSVRATYALSGAVDLDHERLRALEDQVNQAVVLIDRLLNELSADVNRQTTYVNNERHNLQLLSLAIKNGELYGASLVNRALRKHEHGPQPGFRQPIAANDGPAACGHSLRPAERTVSAGALYRG